MYGIQGPESYVYTSRSGCLDVPSIDDLDDFAETLKAMDVVGLTAAEKEEIFRVIAGILWLGNVQFKEDQDGNAMIPDEGVTEFISYLMEVEKTALSKVLITRVMETTRGGRRGAFSGSRFFLLRFFTDSHPTVGLCQARFMTYRSTWPKPRPAVMLSLRPCVRLENDGPRGKPELMPLFAASQMNAYSSGSSSASTSR